MTSHLRQGKIRLLFATSVTDKMEIYQLWETILTASFLRCHVVFVRNSDEWRETGRQASISNRKAIISLPDSPGFAEN